MDLISSMAFASALGAGVIFSRDPACSSFPRGEPTPLAGAAQPVLTAEVINEMWPPAGH